MPLRNEPIKQEPKIAFFKELNEPAILRVECQDEIITANLSDGRIVSIPKAWYKPFREASLNQLAEYELLPQGKGVYFSEIDEYLPVKTFTHGLNSACC